MDYRELFMDFLTLVSLLSQDLARKHRICHSTTTEMVQCDMLAICKIFSQQRRELLPLSQNHKKGK